MSSAQAIHPHSGYTGMAFKPIRWHTNLKVERSPRTYDLCMLSFSHLSAGLNAWGQAGEFSGRPKRCPEVPIGTAGGEAQLGGVNNHRPQFKRFSHKLNAFICEKMNGSY